MAFLEDMNFNVKTKRKIAPKPELYCIEGIFCKWHSIRKNIFYDRIRRNWKKLQIDTLYFQEKSSLGKCALLKVIAICLCNRLLQTNKPASFFYQVFLSSTQWGQRLSKVLLLFYSFTYSRKTQFDFFEKLLINMQMWLQKGFGYFCE